MNKILTLSTLLCAIFSSSIFADTSSLNEEEQNQPVIISDLNYIKEQIEHILPEGHKVFLNYSYLEDEFGVVIEDSVLFNFTAGSEESINNLHDKEG